MGNRVSATGGLVAQPIVDIKTAVGTLSKHSNILVLVLVLAITGYMNGGETKNKYGPHPEETTGRNIWTAVITSRQRSTGTMSPRKHN